MAFRGFEKTVSLQPDGAAGRDLAARLAALARETLAEAQAAGQFPDLYVRAVNGRRDAAEETVRLPGPIVYTADWVRKASAVAIGQLQKRAPVLTGDYRNSFFVLADGAQVEPEEIPFGARVYVTNDRPFSRKIQVGAHGFSDTRGIFDDAAAAVQRLFPGVIRCYVTYVGLEGAYKLKLNAWKRVAYAQNARSAGFRAGVQERVVVTSKKGTAMRYPAIRIDRAVTGWAS